MIPVWVYPLAAALVLAAGWRASARLRIRRRLNAALRSPREMDRKVGARECVAVGVTETARMLVRLVRHEQSRAVLDELLIALAERQWEPASKAAMVDLRIWARGYALEHPEVLVVTSHLPAEDPPRDGAPSVGAAPGRPAVTGPGQPAAQPAAQPATQPATQPVTQPAGPPEPAAASPDDGARAAVAEVAPATILVVPAHGAAAVTTIRELHRLGHRVIATGRDPLAAGLRLADVGEVTPPSDEPGFAVCLLQAARRHGAVALICTSAREHMAVRAAGDEFSAAGVRWALPAADAVRACTDGRPLRDILQDSGLAGPPAGLAGPGARSFTADALISLDGQAAWIVTHWRLETAGGMSARAETFTDHRVSDTCIRALKVLRLTGPASVLGAVTTGQDVVLLGVQPYFSAELPLSIHAGADLVSQHVRQVFGLPVLAERLVPRAGVVMTRHVQESFEE